MTSRVELGRPLVVFDVDGVIGPIADRPDGAPMTLLGFGMWWHEETARQLQRLNREVQLAWSTSWERESADALAPLLGLPAGLPHEFVTGAPRVRGIERLQARFSPSKTVWVDDRPGRGAAAWADASASRLLIRPRTRVGLTPAHWDRIDAFLRGLLR